MAYATAADLRVQEWPEAEPAGIVSLECSRHECQGQGETFRPFSGLAPAPRARARLPPSQNPPYKEKTAGNSCWHRQQAAPDPTNAMAEGTCTGGTGSSDSDVQAASWQLGTVFGVSRRRSSLAPAWRRRIRTRARLSPSSHQTTLQAKKTLADKSCRCRGRRRLRASSWEQC